MREKVLESSFFAGFLHGVVFAGKTNAVGKT
jgi:hypothetical protein